jgi:hypothetical protein
MSAFVFQRIRDLENERDKLKEELVQRKRSQAIE